MFATASFWVGLALAGGADAVAPVDPGPVGVRPVRAPGEISKDWGRNLMIGGGVALGVAAVTEVVLLAIPCDDWACFAPAIGTAVFVVPVGVLGAGHLIGGGITYAIGDRQARAATLAVAPLGPRGAPGLTVGGRF
jgi:hypothetical protein